MPTKSPVAFFIFNRPSLTEKVFEAIRQAQPSRLLVVADGARSAEEEAKCLQTRAILERVDWDCEVSKNFSDVNLGCGHRVASGLDWVFSQVEEAIILEDDCLPAASFFGFSQKLLEHYRHDERVMHISGNNFRLPNQRNNYSYSFSRYPHVWGWATWKRAWHYYDFNMDLWKDNRQLIATLFDDPYERNYWSNIFDLVRKGVIDTWDYQWFLTCWAQNGLSVIPTSNLVSNIGFGVDATHTIEASHFAARIPVTDIWEIEHPPYIVRDSEADLYTFDYRFGGKYIRESDTLLYKSKRYLRAPFSIIKNLF